MLFRLLVLSLATLAESSPSLVSSSQLQKSVSALPLGLWRHLRTVEKAGTVASPRELGHSGQLAFPAVSPLQEYPAHVFQQLVSHDPAVPAPTDGETFGQRYWFDASFYKPGGPVFFLDGGETDGEGRLPFLKEGILRILSEATGGIGVVHEHRYYGESFPVKNLSTDSLRYLTTMQSLHDSAYFARNIVFPGLEQYNLTSLNTPWIYYGGSYAGAKSAFARKLFPDVWWGAIASSAVTTAIIDFWEYYEPIRKSGPEECISLLMNHTALIDTLLSLSQPLLTASLKSFFGLQGVTLDTDFVNALEIPLGAWQGRNWDPSVGSNRFFEFCDAVEADPAFTRLSTVSPEQLVLWEAISTLPGMPTDPRKSFASFSAYAAYIKENVASMCPDNEEQDDCFGTGAYVGDGLEESPWKSWSYQVCTEWGYFIGSPPEGRPSLVSSLMTLDYTSEICRVAFPPGKLNSVPAMPDVSIINAWGSFDLSFPRLAFVDGSEDPWLYATPHSPYASNPNRADTALQPFKLIDGGVHHWDENGRLDGDVPDEIRTIHHEEIKFVRAWLANWDKDESRERR